MSWSCAAVESAVARTVPFVTLWPTVTFTVLTGHVNEPLALLLLLLLVAPPPPEVVATELTMSAVTPNFSP